MQLVATFVVAVVTVVLAHADTVDKHHRQPIYAVTYYDRNHDGVVDLELHIAPGWADVNWGFIDTDLDGSYDLLFVDDAGQSKPAKVSVPCPAGVPIAKEIPKTIVIPGIQPTI